MTLTNNDNSSSDSSTYNNENSILTDNEFNMFIEVGVPTYLTRDNSKM